MKAMGDLVFLLAVMGALSFLFALADIYGGYAPPAPFLVSQAKGIAL